MFLGGPDGEERPYLPSLSDVQGLSDGPSPLSAMCLRHETAGLT
jgi:hypothetical protein